MQIYEFISILSRFNKKISKEHFFNFDSSVDVQDIVLRPHDYFKSSDGLFFKEKVNWYDEVLREFELLQKKKLLLLHPRHPHYPQEFLILENPPLYLVFFGDPEVLKKHRLSVVGSRYPTSRTLNWMDQHIAPVVQKGVVLVSGAARGVDQRAHAISIRNKMPTIAFLPSGLLQAYPRDFQNWYEKILEYGGAIMSEYHCNQFIHAHHFHERNRMIATLGYLLLVCEARRKSGSIMTARLALENSKSVGVVPGFPDEAYNQGCIDLLFQGAFPIRDSQDILSLFEAEKAKRLFIPDLS